MACARFVVTLKPSTHMHFLRHRIQISGNVRAFSALMSPPSTAVVYDHHGPPDTVTKIIQLPPVEIKANDVCVKMLAAPINPSDINQIQGLKSHHLI
ncbi:putative trans-2-enoyl-CoA reductase (NADPH) [Helianthus annuus]|nr:putative trans-2-enoyl-CoA reductase (NADPH) [Helianthus annuus]KAJ0746073.1 putative trans-2-enoyl-CoA reductase (NADPH) [Helianthus annuus]KAJ0749079.1 putative trans-2-enoyl-CoA reductase (NADPH) [Helianthus annuus]